jgi:hypothetical protein
MGQKLSVTGGQKAGNSLAAISLNNPEDIMPIQPAIPTSNPQLMLTGQMSSLPGFKLCRKNGKGNLKESNIYSQKFDGQQTPQAKWRNLYDYRNELWEYYHAATIFRTRFRWSNC